MNGTVKGPVTPKVTVRGKGNKGFSGVRTLSFKITAKTGDYKGVLIGGKLINNPEFPTIF